MTNADRPKKLSTIAEDFNKTIEDSINQAYRRGLLRAAEIADAVDTEHGGKYHNNKGLCIACETRCRIYAEAEADDARG